MSSTTVPAVIGGGEGFEPRRGEASRASPRSPPLIPRLRRCHAFATGSASLCRPWTPAGRGVERRDAGLDWRARRIHFSWMKKASITETKNKLSALIDGLRGGSPVLIVDRGRPVARLEPVTGREEGGQNGRLSRLVRDGVLRSRRTGPPGALFSTPPPRANASAVESLINERREGR